MQKLLIIANILVIFLSIEATTKKMEIEMKIETEIRVKFDQKFSSFPGNSHHLLFISKRIFRKIRTKTELLFEHNYFRTRNRCQLPCDPISRQ